MANLHLMSLEDEQRDEAEWQHWLKGRPEMIQKLGQRFKPWKVYRLTTTGQRCRLYSFSEDNTVTVSVTKELNLINFERRVFGIDPDTLVECEMPRDDEPVGETMTAAEQLAYINMRREQHGLLPLTRTELQEMTMDGQCAMDETERPA